MRRSLAALTLALTFAATSAALALPAQASPLQKCQRGDVLPYGVSAYGVFTLGCIPK